MVVWAAEVANMHVNAITTGSSKTYALCFIKVKYYIKVVNHLLESTKYTSGE